MKRILQAVVLGAGIGATTLAAAATSIGVVNMQTIFKQSTKAKQVNADLQKQFASRKSSLDAMQAKLQTAIQNYSKNKAVLSKVKAAAAQKSIQTQSATLEKQGMQFKQDVYNAQNKAMTQFMATAQAAIAKVAKSKNLDLVVPKNTVLYSQQDMDITNSVLKVLD